MRRTWRQFLGQKPLPFYSSLFSGLTQSSSSNMSEVFYPPTTRSVVLFDGGFLCNICVVSHSPSNQDYDSIKKDFVINGRNEVQHLCSFANILNVSSDKFIGIKAFK